MSDRDAGVDVVPTTLVLRFPPNWTAVIFTATLGLLHWSIVIPAFWAGRFEGELSLILGSLFTFCALACWRMRSELAICQESKEVLLTLKLLRTWNRRTIPFNQVEAVRLMLGDGQSTSESQINIVCHNEDIECPPTRVPRQQALCMAILMDVQLIKAISGEKTEHEKLASERIDRLHEGKESITPDEPTF
jgi:hypothetical protein